MEGLIATPLSMRFLVANPIPFENFSTAFNGNFHCLDLMNAIESWQSGRKFPRITAAKVLKLKKYFIFPEFQLWLQL
jgi:hypothetical protein